MGWGLTLTLLSVVPFSQGDYWSGLALWVPGVGILLYRAR